MTEFNQRNVISNETLGEYLKRARKDANLDIEDVATTLKIQAKYLKAIEASNYKVLPGNVFVKNYVRRYAKFLRLGKNTIEQLLEEELSVYKDKPDIPTTKKHLAKQPLKISNILVVLAIILFSLAIGIYFIFSIANIVQPPELNIEDIPARVSSEHSFITIQGQTIPEATVLINDQAVPVKEDGSFSQEMSLVDGINTFKIIAKTKRSKEHIKYQHIVVEEEQTN